MSDLILPPWSVGLSRVPRQIRNSHVRSSPASLRSPPPRPLSPVPGFSPRRARPQQGLKKGPAAAVFVRGAEAARPRHGGKPYEPPPRPAPDMLEQIDYDAHGKIRFKTDLALWAEGPGRVAGDLLPSRPLLPEAGPHACGREAARRARSSTTAPISTCRRIRPPTSCPTIRALPASASRKPPHRAQLDWRKNDWVAFLGASYFRAIGELYQYGLSARGLAVDVAVFGKNGGISRLHPCLFRDAGAGLRHGDGLRAARRPERRRRLSLSSCSAARPSSWTIEKAPCSCARTWRGSASRR